MLDYYYYILRKRKLSAKKAIRLLNKTNKSKKRRDKILAKSGVKINGDLSLAAPFYYKNGNITLNGKVFINANCTFIDDDNITINDGALIGPNVTLSTATHSASPTLRHSNLQSPIYIGKNVWLGAGVVVLPGVTIGDNSVVGANSVISENIPANCMYATPQAKLIKKLC